MTKIKTKTFNSIYKEGTDELTDEAIDLIHRISHEHSNKDFPGYERDDIKSEIWQICLEKIHYYKPETGPLENFLRVVVHHRLINKFKKLSLSIVMPCKKCKYYNKKAEGHCELYGERKLDCDRWANYETKMSARNSLANTVDVSFASESLDDSAEIDIDDTNVTVGKIRELLPQKYLYDFELFLSGTDISKPIYNKLISMIKDVLK